MKAALFLLAVLLALPGCSGRNGFEGLQAGARQQCQNTPDPEAVRRCEADVNRRSYDNYDRDRPK